MELVLLIGAILAFVLVRSGMDHRARVRAERTRLLEQALANPNLDRATLTALAQQLTGAKPPQQRARRGLAWLLALGWLTLFSGIGVLGLGWLLETKDAVAAGVLVAVIGFGVVTYPFALRELEARRQPQ